jgi:glutamine synthetase
MDEEKALALAKEKYVGLDIHKGGEADKFEALPSCCEESADCLEKVRDIFEKDNVFTRRMIDGILSSLRSFHDKGLLSKAIEDPEKMRNLVDRYFYCG